MRHRRTNKNGSVSLEACIVVPIFMFLMLFVYSFFMIFTAQNSISHALLQSSQSVSLDPHKTEKIGVASGEIPGSVIDALVELLESDDTNFKSDSKWYATDSGFSEAKVTIVTNGFMEATQKVDVTGLSSPLLNDTAKKRFIAYLTGGDEDKAREYLDTLNIVNGLDGITFTALISGEDIYITATYEIEYVFNFQGAAKIPMTQTVCSRMWK